MNCSFDTRVLRSVALTRFLYDTVTCGTFVVVAGMGFSNDADPPITLKSVAVLNQNDVPFLGIPPFHMAVSVPDSVLKWSVWYLRQSSAG